MLAFVSNAISAVLHRKVVRSVAVRAAARRCAAPVTAMASPRAASPAPPRRSPLLERASLRRGPATYGSYLVYGSRV
jgi:hypothetical protein